MIRAETVRTYSQFSRATGREMGATLRQRLGQVPDACWLFCAPLQGLDDLIKGICEAAGTDRIIGCTTSGEISSEGQSVNSAVLGGIVSDCIEFEFVRVQGLAADSAAAGRKLAESFSTIPRYLQIFSDGLTGNGCALLKGIAEGFRTNVPVAGGAAGDNGDFHKTFQFHRGRVRSDAVCGIGFHGDFRLGTAVRSGWVPIGLSKQVTKARGKVVYELNGEPALNVFERFLGHHAEKLPAIGVEYPLGFMKPARAGHPDHQYILRATMSVDRLERSITFAGEIPEGAMVNLTCGDKDSVLAAAGTAAKEAINAMGDGTPELIFCYSCVASRIVLGNRTGEEIERVREQFGPQIPILGFYAYGEYCPVGMEACNDLHNETITLSVLGS